MGRRPARVGAVADGSYSLPIVLAALGASVVIAAAKTTGAAVAAFASRVAEAAHSWVDTGNDPCGGSLTGDRPEGRPPWTLTADQSLSRSYLISSMQIRPMTC